MDMNEFAALSDDEKHRYSIMTDLFNLPGWKHFVDTCNQHVTALTIAGSNAKSWEENRLLLGQRLAYEQVINVQQSLDDEFAELAHERMTASDYDETLEYE